MSSQSILWDFVKRRIPPHKKLRPVVRDKYIIFIDEQVTFEAHLPNGQESRQVIL